MTRWLASSLLTVLLTGFAVVHPACSQNLESDLGAELYEGTGKASSDKPVSASSIFENSPAPRTGLKSIVVPEDISSPAARSIGAYFDSGKKLLTDEIGHCQFRFPAPPTYSRLRATTDYAPILIRNFELKMKGAIVTLAHTNYPKEFTDGHKVDISGEPYKMLTLANDSQLKARPGSKLIARGKIEVQGHPALEQVISYPESKTPQGTAIPAGVVFGRCVLSGRDMYAVSVRLDKKAYELSPEKSKASVKRFMDSLKIIE